MGGKMNEQVRDDKKINTASLEANFPRTIPRSELVSLYEKELIGVEETSETLNLLKEKDELDLFTAIENILQDKSFYTVLDENEKIRVKQHVYDLANAGKGLDKLTLDEHRMTPYDRVQLTRTLIKAILNSTYVDPTADIAVQEPLEAAGMRLAVVQKEGHFPEELYARNAFFEVGTW